jgi:hypothetical protein
MANLPPQLNWQHTDVQPPWTVRRERIIQRVAALGFIGRPSRHVGEKPDRRAYRRDLERLIDEGVLVAERRSMPFSSRKFGVVVLAPDFVVEKKPEPVTPKPFAKRKQGLAELAAAND